MGMVKPTGSGKDCGEAESAVHWAEIYNSLWLLGFVWHLWPQGTVFISKAFEFEQPKGVWVGPLASSSVCIVCCVNSGMCISQGHELVLVCGSGFGNSWCRVPKSLHTPSLLLQQPTKVDREGPSIFFQYQDLFYRCRNDNWELARPCNYWESWVWNADF